MIEYSLIVAHVLSNVVWLTLKTIVHTNLPQPGFELRFLGPQASVLPIVAPLLVWFVNMAVDISVFLKLWQNKKVAPCKINNCLCHGHIKTMNFYSYSSLLSVYIYSKLVQQQISHFKNNILRNVFKLKITI